MAYFDVSNLIGGKGSKWGDALLVLCLLAYVAGLLAVRKATNVCFFLLFSVALAHFLFRRTDYLALPEGKERFLLALAFAAPFVAVALTKLLRLEFSYRDLDAESRYLVGGLLLCFFMVKRVNFSRVFEVSLPLALIAALIATLIGAWWSPEVPIRWGGRYATTFVDPNVLGSYSAILTFMALITFGASGAKLALLKALQALGIAAGLLLTLLAASRGGWLTVIPLFILWLCFRARGNGKRLLAGSFLLAIVIAVGICTLPGLKERVTAPFSDVTQWAEGSNKITAPGQRLSIWKLSLHLISEKPLVGWGIPGTRAQVVSPETAPWANEIHNASTGDYGGAHNDALQMMLQSGVWGLLAYLLLLLVPLRLFLVSRRDATGDVRLACELGACLVIGVLVAGLTNELLSLKYLVSFYTLSIAGLAAQVLGRNTTASSNKVGLS